MKNKAQSKNRRKLILGSLTGAGAISAGGWSKPMINAVLLPAHAQMSEMEPFSGQFIDNDVSITVFPNAYFKQDKESIFERVASIVIPSAHAGHSSPEGGHVVIDVVDETFSATIISEEDINGGDQQFFGSGGTVDGSALRLDLTRGGECADQFYAEVTVSNVTETTADYDFSVFDPGDGDSLEYSGTGTAMTGQAAPADLPDDCNAPMTSDIRLKTSIESLQRTESGLQLYRFQYLADKAKVDYVGVMAQDLVNTHPDALVFGEDGFYKVHYDKLGLKMTTFEQWNEFGMDSVIKH